MHLIFYILLLKEEIKDMEKQTCFLFLLLLLVSMKSQALYPAAQISYLTEACTAAGFVFEAFTVCCDFVAKAGLACLQKHLGSLDSAEIPDLSLFEGCIQSRNE